MRWVKNFARVVANCGGKVGLLEKPFGAAADDEQEVVEVVRDTAGELADSFHPLDLREAVLKALGLRGRRDFAGFGLWRLLVA